MQGPLLGLLAADSPRRGGPVPEPQGGALSEHRDGFATRYNVAGAGFTFLARNDAPELKVGLGYRLPFTAARKTGFVLFGGIDYGSITNITFSTPGNPLREGAVSSRTSHFAGEITLGVSLF
jgi:hypothetical protein